MGKNKSSRIKWKTILISGGLVIFLTALFCFAIQNYVNKVAKGFIVTAENAPQAEAILILGAKVYADGSPSSALKDRLDYALELYENGKAPKLLVSGDHGTRGYNEVGGMRDYLLEKGVPREDIFLDHAGFDTYDSIYRAKNIFGIQKLLISTQQFHMERSLYIARRLGMEAYGYPSKDKEAYGMNRLYVREMLAKIKAYFDTDVLHSKSKYLGESIPIIGDGIVTEG